MPHRCTMLKTRVITAFFLLIGFVGVLFVLPGWAAAFVFALVVALAAWEWAKLLGLGNTRRIVFAWATLAAAEYLAVSHIVDTAFPFLCALSVAFWVLLAPFWLHGHWRLKSEWLGYIVGWCVILPTWAALLMIYRKSPWILLAAMASVWIADSFAYFTGRAIGKHKLAPSISPGKTREGVVGAIVAVLIYGFVLAAYAWSGMTAARAAALAAMLVLLTVLSVMGDLFESLLKRQAGLKDSSNLLPGHGGVLDRIDSQTSTLPLVALCLYWIGTL